MDCFLRNPASIDNASTFDALSSILRVHSTGKFFPPCLLALENLSEGNEKGNSYRGVSLVSQSYRPIYLSILLTSSPRIQIASICLPALQSDRDADAHDLGGDVNEIFGLRITMLLEFSCFYYLALCQII